MMTGRFGTGGIKGSSFLSQQEILLLNRCFLCTSIKLKLCSAQGLWPRGKRDKGGCKGIIMAEGQAFWDQPCIKLPGLGIPKHWLEWSSHPCVLGVSISQWLDGWQGYRSWAEVTPTIDSQLHLPGGIASSIGGSAHVFPALFSPWGHHIQASIRPCWEPHIAGKDYLSFLRKEKKLKSTVPGFSKIKQITII